MNVGQLFREFNEYRHLLDGDKTIDENINVFTREKLRDFLKIVSDEGFVLEKIKVFVGQQYKKLSKSKEQKDLDEEKRIETNQQVVPEKRNTDIIEDKTSLPNKIQLYDEVYLLIEGCKRTLIFPEYKIIY